MADTSILRLAEDPAGIVSWVNVPAAPPAADATAPAIDVQQGSLADAATPLSGRRVIVLVPATHLLLTSALLPTRNRQRVVAAVPNVLEEQLASDIDHQHFALGRYDASGRLAVAVVAKAAMDEWLARLAAAGIRPAMLAPDVLALPHEPNTWTVCRLERHALVRTGAQSGFGCDSDNLAALLRAALDEAGEARPARVIALQDVDVSAAEAAGIEVRRIGDSVMEAFARGCDESQLIDLLQGAYSRREQIGKLWRPWRLTAALAGVWLVLHVAVTITDYVRLSREDSRLREQIAQLYRDTFPDARAIDVSLMEREMTRRAAELRSGGDGGGLLSLLNGLGQPLAATGGLELQRMSFSDGQIELALTIKDLQGLDRLKQQLAAQPGLDVQIQSASARDNLVEARLQIKGKSS